MNNGLPETVEYPILVVEGEPFKVKFTTGTLLRLQREGVDMEALTLAQKERRMSIEQSFQILAACISHGKKKFTGEELADLLSPNEFKAAMDALKGAFSKVSAQDGSGANPTEAAPEQPSESSGG